MSGSPKAVFSVTGNLTRDVELSILPNGSACATYTIAANDSYVDKAGKTVDTTDFFMVKSYGRQAKRDAQMLMKGSFIKAEGQLKSWYSSEKQRGGINFVVHSVKPLARCNPAPQEESTGPQSSSPADQHDDWAQEYAEASAAYDAEYAKQTAPARSRK